MNSVNTQIYLLETETTVGNNWIILKCICSISCTVMSALKKNEKRKSHKKKNRLIFAKELTMPCLNLNIRKEWRSTCRMNVCHF